MSFVSYYHAPSFPPLRHGLHLPCAAHASFVSTASRDFLLNCLLCPPQFSSWHWTIFSDPRQQVCHLLVLRGSCASPASPTCLSRNLSSAASGRLETRLCMSHAEVAENPALQYYHARRAAREMRLIFSSADILRQRLRWAHWC